MAQNKKQPKPYHTPKLEIHGQLSTLTQQTGSVVFTTLPATFLPE